MKLADLEPRVRHCPKHEMTGSRILPYPDPRTGGYFVSVNHYRDLLDIQEEIARRQGLAHLHNPDHHSKGILGMLNGHPVYTDAYIHRDKQFNLQSSDTPVIYSMPWQLSHDVANYLASTNNDSRN
ncbi:hypothetical protein GR7B_00197 [Vibrio phage vB_VcorM_GR7B]|nr:hypothetical protein GR7B_00197 [Vibrio phage vB_VcorM_GR7B]